MRSIISKEAKHKSNIPTFVLLFSLNTSLQVYKWNCKVVKFFIRVSLK